MSEPREPLAAWRRFWRWLCRPRSPNAVVQANIRRNRKLEREARRGE